MGALTPQFVAVDLETRMQVLTESEYVRLTQSLWYQVITKTRPSTGKKEILTWLLSTAQIRDQGDGGNISFNDLVATYTEVENRFAGDGFKISRAQLEDTDGGGMDLSGQWARDIGAYMAYWPQKQVSYFLKNAHTASLFTGYDGKAFFATDHPVNPLAASLGVYPNLLTGGNAFPIDDSVTAEVALQNLGKLYSLIASVKMPNGEDPRFLQPESIICSPRMYPRVTQLTSAKFLAQTAGSGAGSGDVEALIKALGFATPVVAPELAGFESDSTYFVACKQVSSSQLGAVIYLEREMFKINYYGVLDQAELDRKNELEWHCRGRNAVAPGHPYLLFKCKAA